MHKGIPDTPFGIQPLPATHTSALPSLTGTLTCVRSQGTHVFRRRQRRTSDDGEQGNTLSRLLVNEEQLATRLQQASQEAAQILADAAAYDQEVESGCAQLIEDRISILKNRYLRELDTELETIRVDADRESELFTRVSPQRMSELVARILARLVAIDDVPRSTRA